MGEILNLARIFQPSSAATPFSAASADRIAETPLRSVPTRLHRHSADSINPDDRALIRAFLTMSSIPLVVEQGPSFAFGATGKFR